MIYHERTHINFVLLLVQLLLMTEKRKLVYICISSGAANITVLSVTDLIVVHMKTGDAKRSY
ncbi:hypothetical protein CS542_10145 [Pedobacter sp. IW39]|nr:hypothetical protein CS542_10145 [Pedobacter sp. IW39]